jgi:hypothetical protein
MRNWLAVGVVVGMVGSWAVGCSSSSPTMNVTTFCQQLAQAECRPVVKTCVSLNENTCETAVENTCSANATLYQNAGRTFNASAVQTCISAMESTYAQVSTNSPILAWSALNGSNGTAAPASGSPNDLCELVFQGTKAANDPCTSTYDCTSGNVCGSNGLCGVESDKSAGQPCADPGDLCTGGTVCVASGKTFLCSGAKVGASCNSSTPCVISAQCQSGKCVQLGEKGSACTSNADCDPTGSYPFCDPADNLCYTGYDFANNSECTAFGKSSSTSPSSGKGSSSKTESSSAGGESSSTKSASSGTGSTKSLHYSTSGLPQ